MSLSTKNLVSHYLVIGTDNIGVNRRIKVFTRKDAETIADTYMIRARLWAVNPHGRKKLERRYTSY
jgi:hypothetical protein